MTKTKFANNVNPFTGLKVGAVDVSKLRISNDPILRARAVPLSKYDSVFSALKPGQCIVCEDGSAPKIKTALDKWLEHRGSKFVTKAMARYTDGKGRVWLLEDQ
jgi:Na+-transporting NADH:ubiquinone oxidoreductase subunit NqrD